MVSLRNEGESVCFVVDDEICFLTVVEREEFSHKLCKGGRGCLWYYVYLVACFNQVCE